MGFSRKSSVTLCISSRGALGMRALSYGGDVGLRTWPPLVKTPQLRRVGWPSAQQESEDTFDMLDALLGKDVDIPPAAPRRDPPSPPSKPLRPPVEAKREMRLRLRVIPREALPS